MELSAKLRLQLCSNLLFSSLLSLLNFLFLPFQSFLFSPALLALYVVLFSAYSFHAELLALYSV